MTTRTIKIEKPVRWIFLTAGLSVCLAGALLSAKWSFGNTISLRSEFKEVAEVAVALAPADPQSHYALAVLAEKSFQPDQLSTSIAEYEKAAALAPYDYRVWLALGSARERRGDGAGAELALRRALLLAPEYSQVQWRLGNVLLRMGRMSQAFDEIRKAAEKDRTYLNPAVETAWQIFDGDLAETRKNLGSNVEVNFALVVFLAKKKRFDEALQVWTSLPSGAKQSDYRDTGKRLSDEMLAAKQYRGAMEVLNQIAGPNEEVLRIGAFSNPGFESDVESTGAGFFDWQISEGFKPQIGLETGERHGGARSLIFVFDSKQGNDFRILSQTIAVDGGQNYRFATFYKSDLKAEATLRWEIFDTADGQVLASTAPIKPVSEWTELAAGFTTSEETGAVTVRLARENCTLLVCPITGRVWFDDFTLDQ